MTPIPNFEEYYSVTEDGKIYRTKYDDGSNKSKYKVPRELGVETDRYGYYKIVLSKNGKMYYKTVHRVVAETFIPNPNCLPQVNHKNGIKTDNRVCNLEWVSAKDNILHAKRTGLHKGVRTKVLLVKEDERMLFNSITDAIYFLGHDKSCFARHETFDSRHGIIDGYYFTLIGGKRRTHRGGDKSV